MRLHFLIAVLVSNFVSKLMFMKGQEVRVVWSPKHSWLKTYIYIYIHIIHISYIYNIWYACTLDIINTLYSNSIWIQKRLLEKRGCCLCSRNSIQPIDPASLDGLWGLGDFGDVLYSVFHVGSACEDDACQDMPMIFAWLVFFSHVHSKHWWCIFQTTLRKVFSIRGYFCGADWYWSWFDVFCVGLAYLEMCPWTELTCWSCWSIASPDISGT